jgi:hypothetical protein
MLPPRFHLAHHKKGRIATGGGCNINLSVTVIRIAPTSALEKAVRSSDPAEGDTTRQIAARINHATSKLAYV